MNQEASLWKTRRELQMPPTKTNTTTYRFEMQHFAFAHALVSFWHATLPFPGNSGAERHISWAQSAGFNALIHSFTAYSFTCHSVGLLSLFTRH